MLISQPRTSYLAVIVTDDSIRRWHRGFRTFRQVAGAGSSEGYTSEGLGVRARLPFRVFTLAGPGNTVRLVIDKLMRGHVHELHLPGIRDRQGAPLLHDVAYYTLNEVPKP